MNKKNQKMLMILCLVLTAFCAVYIAVTKIAESRAAKEAAESEANANAARVFAIDMSEVTALTLNTGEAELAFVKDGETWRYKEDDQFPADQGILGSIAEAMKKFEADRKLEGGDDLSDYGFGKDNVSVTAADGDGNEKTIVYGSAVGDGYYIKTADEDAVYTADSLMYGQFQGKTLYDFVEAETLPTTFSDSITQVRLEIGGKTYDYDKPEEEAFDNLSAAIPGMTIEKCADYNAGRGELKKYGLDKPQMTIEYTYTDADGHEKTQVIDVGSMAEKDGGTGSDAYYIRLGGSDMVNTISAASIDGLKGYVEK